MMHSTTFRIIYFVFFPLAAAFLIALFGRRIKYFGEAITSLVALILCVNSFSVLNLVQHQKMLLFRVGGWGSALGITLVADGLSSLMLVIVNLISFLVMIYSVTYIKKYTDRWKFQALLMLMLTGMNGVIISGDLFNLYVFLEVASISAYVLVAFGIEPEDLEASFKYAIMGIIASIFILLGIGLLYSYTSTLNMTDVSLVLFSHPAGILTGFISVLFIVGFGLKAAIVPFHSWLPDAHSCAPSPVSAMLSGLLIKTLGIYALARVLFNILGTSTQLLSVLMILGVISMLTGAFLAVAQNDIKRMFAYSSISQIGYIVFALGIGTPLAILGGIFYLVNHAFSKSLLFLNAGAIEHSCSSRDLRKLGGLNDKMPVTGATSLIGAMSISGIPPFGGFWAKLTIIIAAVQAGHVVFAAIAVLVSILTLVYYLKFQTLTFFGKLNNALSDVKEAPLFMKISGIILSIICILAGLLLLPAFKPFLQQAADALLIG